MLKDKLVAAVHVTAPHARKYGPWMTIATSSLVIADHLLRKEN